MEPEGAHLDRRRHRHDLVAARLAALGDDPLAALVPETGDRGAPVAKIFRRFLFALSGGSKMAPYPAAELEAAFAAQSNLR